ncbi:hypothetical protein B0O99DRAFT_610730 [Bisporella sp. PMI_857]|nr:hypothetical protein B0O99DRAFT_612477 [Bisporella sp. PMI_857]KAH8600456.1 hypothetical protein B0O99DRAFT_610730 [Bisporella sp. PMI_857]
MIYVAKISWGITWVEISLLSLCRAGTLIRSLFFCTPQSLPIIFDSCCCCISQPAASHFPATLVRILSGFPMFRCLLNKAALIPPFPDFQTQDLVVVLNQSAAGSRLIWQVCCISSTETFSRGDGIILNSKEI